MSKSGESLCVYMHVFVYMYVCVCVQCAYDDMVCMCACM